MEACIGGAVAGSVDGAAKSALESWISGAGASFFDPATCSEIRSWCTGPATYALQGWAQMAMEGAMIAESSVAAAGGIFPFFNGIIEGGFNGAPCACSVMGASARGELIGFLNGAAAMGLDSVISGALHMCASGGMAAAMTGSAIGELQGWLSSSSCSLPGDLKGGVQRWCGVATGGATGGSVASESLALAFNVQS